MHAACRLHGADLLSVCSSKHIWCARRQSSCRHCRPYEKTFDNWFGGFTPCFVDVILLGAMLSVHMRPVHNSGIIHERELVVPKCWCYRACIAHIPLTKCDLWPATGGAHLTAIVLCIIRLSYLRSRRSDKCAGNAPADAWMQQLHGSFLTATLKC